MSTNTVGADADQLDQAAQQLRAAAAELDAQAGSLSATLRSVAWVGGVATRFGGYWNRSYRPNIVRTADSVRQAADRLEANAAEQRAASRATGGSGGASGIPFSRPSDMPGTGAPRVDPPPPRPQDLPGFGSPPGPTPRPGPGDLPGMGSSGGSSSGSGSWGDDPSGVEVAADLSESAANVLDLAGDAHFNSELVHTLARLDQAANGSHEFIDLLASPTFKTVLDGADQFISAGEFVTDAVADYADHSELEWDDRLVHALADAGSRLLIGEAAEKGAEFLAGALVTTLLPGVGGILAPFAAQLTGMFVEEMMNLAVDAIDGATDVIDHMADAMVDLYQQAKNMFGVVADVAGAVADVAGGTVDLAASAGSVVVDGGEIIVSGVADAGGVVYDTAINVGDAIGDGAGWVVGEGADLVDNGFDAARGGAGWLGDKVFGG